MSQEILLLVQKCAHTFSFYDIDSGAVLRHIRLPEFPNEFVVDSRQRYAYVGHYGVESSSSPYTEVMTLPAVPEW